MTDDKAMRLVLISAGVTNPSSTKMLGDRIVSTTTSLAQAQGIDLSVTEIDLRDLAGDLASASVTGMTSQKLRDAAAALEAADGVIAATPVYKASYSGLFKQFIDILDDDVFLAMPVVLAATAGTPRHALVPDTLMRPLFAYMRAAPTPTSLFAATEDWGADSRLDARIERAATELLVQMQSGVREQVLRQAGAKYRTSFKTAGTSPDDDGAQIDFDTDLMRLATGG